MLEPLHVLTCALSPLSLFKLLPPWSNFPPPHLSSPYQLPVFSIVHLSPSTGSGVAVRSTMSLSLDLGKDTSNHSCHWLLHSPFPLSCHTIFSHCGQFLMPCCCFTGNWKLWVDPTPQVISFNHFPFAQKPQSKSITYPLICSWFSKLIF